MAIVDMNKNLVSAQKAPEGPVVMVNLYRLKKGAEFADFHKAMQGPAEQAFRKTNGETLYAGVMGGDFITGEDHWDRIALMKYPSWQSVIDFFDDEELIGELNAIRREYLDDSRWILSTPLGG